MDKHDLSFFDRTSEWLVVERSLPHWSQAGCVCFVTWRLADSLPADALHRLDAELLVVLAGAGLNPHADWKTELARRDTKSRGKIHWKLFATRDKFLDSGYGGCHLAKSGCAKIVLDSLLHFDRQRYFLTDAVIMPNHIHFLAAFANEDLFLKQCTQWKRFTGRKINAKLQTRGEFWQVDQFDHLIRGPEQFDYYRRYRAENPLKAGLAKNQYLHFQKSLT